jgi:hypothetical protein
LLAARVVYGKCLWEETSIDDADVRASTFGVEYFVREDLNVGAQNIDLDYLRVRVYYGDAAGDAGSTPVMESWNVAESASTNSLSVTKPTGLASGDTALIFAVCDIANAREVLRVDNTAFRPINIVGDNSNGLKIAAWVLPNATGSEASSQAIVADTFVPLIGWYIRFSGCDTVDPIDSIDFAELTSASTHTLPSITTLRDNCRLVYLLGCDSETADPFSTPTGYTEVDEEDVTASAGVWGHKEQATAGSAGGETLTSSATDGSACMLLALRAALSPDITITCSPEVLTFTEKASTVNTARDITSSPEALNVTEQASNVYTGRAALGTPESLIVTENAATVNSTRDVTTTPDVLTLTENAAITNNARGVTTTPDVITLTENAAITNNARGVTTTFEVITLTENAATVNNARGVTTTPGTIVLTENAAIANKSRVLTCVTEVVVVTKNNATVERVLNLLTATELIGLDEQTAGVIRVHQVTGATGIVALTEQAATVNNNRVVSCTSDVLNLSENSATLIIDKGVFCATEIITLTANAASITPERVVTGITEIITISTNPGVINPSKIVQSVTEQIVVQANGATLIIDPKYPPLPANRVFLVEEQQLVWVDEPEEEVRETLPL